MRLITALSIAACLLAPVPAFAQGRAPVKLELTEEPVGQPFTPPSLRVLPLRGYTQSQAQTQFDAAHLECSSWVQDIYSHRREIYLSCLRQTASQLGGFRFVVMDDPDAVAAEFGVNRGN